MAFEDYEPLLTVLLAALLAFGPWMLMVHAKLAVLVAKTAELCDKLEKLADSQQRLWQRSADHETRLDRHEVQIGYLDERIREIAS